MTRHEPDTQTRIATPSLDGVVQVVVAWWVEWWRLWAVRLVWPRVVEVMGCVVVWVDFNRWDFGGQWGQWRVDLGGLGG